MRCDDRDDRGCGMCVCVCLDVLIFVFNGPRGSSLVADCTSFPRILRSICSPFNASPVFCWLLVDDVFFRCVKVLSLPFKQYKANALGSSRMCVVYCVVRLLPGFAH